VKARTSDRSVIDYAAGEPHAPEELKDRYLKLQPKQRSFLNALVSARQAAVSAETRSSREETEVVGEIIVSLLLKESFGQGCVIEGPDVEKNPTLGFLDEGWTGTLTESGELPLDYLVTEPASMRLTQAVSHVVDKLKQELKEAEKPKKSVKMCGDSPCTTCWQLFRGKSPHTKAAHLEKRWRRLRFLQMWCCLFARS
jgi:hypothetical protein